MPSLLGLPQHLPARRTAGAWSARLRGRTHGRPAGVVSKVRGHAKLGTERLVPHPCRRELRWHAARLMQPVSPAWARTHVRGEAGKSHGAGGARLPPDAASPALWRLRCPPWRQRCPRASRAPAACSRRRALRCPALLRGVCAALRAWVPPRVRGDRVARVARVTAPPQPRAAFMRGAGAAPRCAGHNQGFGSGCGCRTGALTPALRGAQLRRAWRRLGGCPTGASGR